MNEPADHDVTHLARTFLAEALGVPADQVPDGAALGDPAAWDSLGHMRLVLALEERRGQQLTPEQIIGIESLADVAALLQTPARLGSIFT
jgi:acyl carrier protein